MAKTENYDDITLTDSQFITDLDNKYTKSDYTDTEDADFSEYVYYSCTGENDEHYQIQIGLKRYYLDEEKNEESGKQIKVTVFYPIGNKTNSIDISWATANK